LSTIHKIDNEHIEYKDSQEKLEQLEYTESGVFSKSEKTLETKTVESELEFRTLFDHSYDAIFLIRDFVIIDSNKKTLNLFGYTKEEIVGKSPMYLSPTIQPDGSDSYKKGMQKMNDTLKGIPQFFEWTHTKKSGTNFDAEISLNRIVIDKETYVQAIVRDITEQKKTKDMLLLTQFTIDHASESIFWIRSDGGIMYTNEASIELLGYSHEEYKSMAIYDIDHDFNIEKSA